MRPGVLVAIGVGTVALAVLAYASQPSEIPETTTTVAPIAAPVDRVTSTAPAPGHEDAGTRREGPAQCESAPHLTKEWQDRMPQGVAVHDLWMVLSREVDLISWRFISGRVSGGVHDGEIATWAIPVYSGAGAPPQAVPANEAATDPSRPPSPLDQNAYRIDDWLDIDGARISQWCVETFS